MTESRNDRLPTESDANNHGFVLECVDDTWLATPWHMVRGTWMRQPPPPKPPVGTSLAASIERREKASYFTMHPYGKDCECTLCDDKRVIEAARKWDEQERNRVTTKLDDVEVPSHVKGGLPINDHDGVGEGWRRLMPKEAVRNGDHARSIGSNDWWEIECDDVKWAQLNGIEYRRRIEAE